MPDASADIELRDLLRRWVPSDPGVRLAAFYHQNPSVIETPAGLAQRLAIDVGLLRPAIVEHVRLGVLRERRLGETTVLLYDRARDREVQKRLSDRLHNLQRERR